YVQWSPDETKFAFAVSNDTKIELYVANVATATATRLTDRALNAAYGSPFQWVSDSKSLIVKLVPDGRGAAMAANRVPVGPTMQDNSSGSRGQAPTYQDLLKSPSDEKQFAYFATSQVTKLGLDGSVQPIGQPGIIATASPSPDGKLVMVETVHTPFSYLVPVYRFPTRTDVFAMGGQLVKTLNDGPLQESVPYSSDGAPSGPRDFEWRNDAPASIYYTVAQDKGDPKVKADVRDRVFLVEAPFTVEPKAIYDAAFRFRGFTWGNANTALATEGWWQTRKIITKVVNPSANYAATVLFERSSEDRYANPGQPDTHPNQYGRDVLNILPNNDIMLVNGQGASPEGDRPFVSVMNLTTKKITPLWRSEAPVFERPIAVLDAATGVLLTTRETPDENPNYFIRNLKKRIAP
ncbi:MAG: S9 family peptidase, partial [Cytophagaceae bacterium]